MGTSPERLADILVFEIRVARLYVQDRLSTKQIAERLGCSIGKVASALTECGITRECRITWMW